MDTPFSESDELQSRLLEYAPDEMRDKLRSAIQSGKFSVDDFIDKKSWKFLLYDEIWTKLNLIADISQASENIPLSLRERYKDRYHFPFKVYKDLQITNHTDNASQKIEDLARQVRHLEEKVRELSNKLNRS